MNSTAEGKSTPVSKINDDNIFILNTSACDADVDKTQVITLLPQWKTYLLEAKIIEKDDFPKLNLKFLLKAHNEEEIKKWLAELQDFNKTTYSIYSTADSKGKYVNFKQRLVCQHNTRSKNVYEPSIKSRTNTKNTNCPSKITVVLHAVKKRYQGKDKEKYSLLREMPCEVTFIATHNHSTLSADSLRFRKVSNEVKEKLLNLFHNGHSASTALKCLKIDIQLNNDNYEEILADRKHCPTYDDCYHLYRQEFEKIYGPWEFNSRSRDFLKKKLNKFNEEMGDDCAKIIYQESDYAICICPPLFKRVHEHISSASDLVFIESTETVDRDGSRVFILLTDSDCGGLPLGIIITSCESTDIIILGFQQLQRMLGDKIFGGKVDGPSIFITDDSALEEVAIKTVWPKSKNVMCTFHVLQSVWRWLIKTKNGIPQEKQVFLYNQFKDILHASTESDCIKKFEEARIEAIHFPNYYRYLIDYWNRRELWAKAYINNLPVRENHTNNYSEAAVRILKDKVFFNCIKTFNLVQIVDFLTTKFVSYYKLRLLDAAHNRIRRNIFTDHIRLPPPGLLEHIQVLNNNIILVPSENEENLFYMVNMDVLICGCFNGNTRGGCKHIDWASMVVDSEKYNTKIDNIATRKLMYFIATGSSPLKQWFNPLYTESSSSFKKETANKDEPMQDGHSLSENIVGNEKMDEDENINSNDNSYQVETSKSSAKVILNNINATFTQFIDKSPLEVAAAMEIMYGTLQKIKDPSTFASCCINFGSNIHRRNRGNYLGVLSESINRRKTSIMGKKSHVGGRPRKSVNFPNKRLLTGHKLSKNIISHLKTQL